MLESLNWVYEHDFCKSVFGRTIQDMEVDRTLLAIFKEIFLSYFEENGSFFGQTKQYESCLKICDYLLPVLFFDIALIWFSFSYFFRWWKFLRII